MTATRWTLKLPALVIGVVLVIAGALGWKRSAAIGLVLFVIGGGFIGYSLTIKDWCEQWGSAGYAQGWGGGFGHCLKEKGWLAF